MPRVSVIIPVYEADASLPTVLDALRPQVTDDVEVLLVDSTGLDHAASLGRDHSWLQVLGRAERMPPGAARNAGVQIARGRQLAFLDADAVPGPDWLARLRCGLHTGRAAVVGAVQNGTPDSSVGTASYLLEFSEWTPRRPGTPAHGVTCNLLVDRSAFEAAGGFCDDVWMGEDTILTLPWGQSGRLGFAADAVVSHLNRTGLDQLLTHQHRLGRAFATVCDRVEFPGSGFSRWPCLAAAPAARLGVLLRRLSYEPDLRRAAWTLSPLLALGLTAWGAGAAAERGMPGRSDSSAGMGRNLRRGSTSR